MTEQARHVAVGLTVVVALAILAALIVIFTGVPEMFSPGYRLQILFDSAQDAKTGDPVRLAGMRIGSILDIAFTEGDARRGVTFTVRIDSGVRIPGNINAYVHSRGFVGSGYIELKPDGPPRIDPATGKEAPYLPTDRVTVIQGTTFGDGGVIPAEITEAIRGMEEGFEEVGRLAATLNRLIGPLAAPTAPAGTQAATGPASQPAPSEGLRLFVETFAKFGRTLDDLHAVLGDKENQAHLKEALARLGESAGKATEAMSAMKAFAEDAGASVRATSQAASGTVERVGELADRLIDNAEKLSDVLASLNRAATKLEQGAGTAGRLLNDPKLYNSLADAGEQLSKLIAELRQLVQRWQDSGVGVKLK